MKVQPNRPYRASQLGLDDPDGVLWGVYVGGCIDERSAWGIWESTRSHSHNHKSNHFYGWVCILNPKDVLTSDGRMTGTLAHEIAHLMAANQLHSRTWKRALVKMGYAQEVVNSGFKPL